MEKIKINNEYYTHLPNLHTVLNRMPEYLINNYITDDYIVIKTEYLDTIPSYTDWKRDADYYKLTMTNLKDKTPTIYHIYVPLKDKKLDRIEYNKLINTIEETMMDDYNFYKEDK